MLDIIVLATIISISLFIIIYKLFLVLSIEDMLIDIRDKDSEQYDKAISIFVLRGYSYKSYQQIKNINNK